MTPKMKLDLKYVTSRPNKDGSQRYYFRRRGQPVSALPSDPLSPEFMIEYNRLLKWQSPSLKEKHGSFAWLCDQYMDSMAFTSKAKATQLARRRIIKTILDEPIDPAHSEAFGMERAEAISEDHIEVLRDRKAAFPNAANERVKILRQIFKFAKKKKLVKLNPMTDIERLVISSDGHKTATDADLEKYLAYHPTGAAKLAMTLLMDYGMRVSDLRLIGKRNVKDGVLSFITEKSGMLCELPIPQGREYPNQLFFLHNEQGKPFLNDKVMSARVSIWFKQAGIEGITGHSVRKWLAVKMAESGATDTELMSWFGWRDPKEARPYTQTANRKIMAASAGRKRGA